jgi:hypothetical protein
MPIQFWSKGWIAKGSAVISSGCGRRPETIACPRLLRPLPESEMPLSGTGFDANELPDHPLKLAQLLHVFVSSQLFGHCDLVPNFFAHDCCVEFVTRRTLRECCNATAASDIGHRSHAATLLNCRHYERPFSVSDLVELIMRERPDEAFELAQAWSMLLKTPAWLGRRRTSCTLSGHCTARMASQDTIGNRKCSVSAAAPERRFCPAHCWFSRHAIARRQLGHLAKR